MTNSQALYCVLVTAEGLADTALAGRFLPTIPFTSELEAFGDGPAAIGSDGQAVTYSQLAARADALAEQLGTARRLVFLEAANSIESLIGYVACLRAGHPMFLWSRPDRAKLDSLILRYKPNVVISSGSAGSEV